MDVLAEPHGDAQATAPRSAHRQVFRPGFCLRERQAAALIRFPMKNSSPQHSHASAGNPSARDSVPVEKNRRARPLLDEKQNRRSAPAHRCIDHLLPEVCLWKRQNSALICFPIHKQRQEPQANACGSLSFSSVDAPFSCPPDQEHLPMEGRISSPAGNPASLRRSMRLPARWRPGGFSLIEAPVSSGEELRAGAIAFSPLRRASLPRRSRRLSFPGRRRSRRGLPRCAAADCTSRRAQSGRARRS